MSEPTYIIVQPSYEPMAKWKAKIGPMMLIMWCRPGDFCFGVQAVHGGALFTIWPISFGIVHIGTASRKELRR